ncbi:Rrf2 family transcriptional regulator [Ostreiculturibacter nitratireducens]|uniref:RrF2 family transcriptional regulator n=1 Tax=Ostreiculturibacter nitratireducens TaxID=3075226 RepID=UPI0031B5F1C0
MRLTKFTDFALRILLLTASERTDRLTIEEAAERFGISLSHAKKVVLTLSRAGYLRASRGRTGGIALGREPEDINLGAVIRLTEPDFGLFECFLPGNQCILSRACRLPPVANEALQAFVAVFDRYTLADMLVRPGLFVAAHSEEVQPRRGPILPKPASA